MVLATLLFVHSLYAWQFVSGNPPITKDLFCDNLSGLTGLRLNLFWD